MSVRPAHARVRRLAAVPAAAALVALSATPAAAHVTGTPSVANAGAFTVLTMSVPHGCEGSPTTKVEIQVPDSVVSVTPTRNPFYSVRTTTEQIDPPITDEEGNEVTERIGTVVYTARTPLPDGQRDTFELSFQVPDRAGEVLAFPTIQTCEQGRTAWTEIPAAGQSEDELEHPAPAFEILPDGDSGAASGAPAEAAGEPDGGEDDDSDALGWVALAAGVLGLVAGGAALARSRKPA